MPQTVTLPDLGEISTTVQEGESDPLVVRVSVVLTDPCLCGRPRRQGTLIFDVPITAPCKHAESRLKAVATLAPIAIILLAGVSVGVDGHVRVTCATCHRSCRTAVSAEYLDESEWSGPP